MIIEDIKAPLLVLLTVIGFPAAQAGLPDADDLVAETANVQLAPANEHGRFRYLVGFDDPGLIEQFRRRPDRTPGQPFDPRAPEAAARRAELLARQETRLEAIRAALVRAPAVTHRFLVTHSGMAMMLSSEEAVIARRLPGVASVRRERIYQLATYNGPYFIGAAKVWDGSATGEPFRGEGMVIGVLDTGVAADHPAFSNDPACGHGQGAVPDKLLSVVACDSTDDDGMCSGSNPQDTIDHGTHVAATAGGNRLGPTDSPPPEPPAGFDEISGVAPCAHIRSYKVCPSQTCPEANIQAGMNSVLLHGDVDVMNFSISGGTSPWTDNDRRKLDLVDAGVLVAASAGNTRAEDPDPIGRVQHRGPWVMSVAAVHHDELPLPLLSLAGPGTPPDGTQNILTVPGSTTPPADPLTNFPVRHFDAQDPEAEGCSDTEPAFPADFFAGAAALIRRGACTFTEKITNAYNAGAELVLVVNNVDGSITMSTPDAPVVPSYSMARAAGERVIEFVNDHPDTAVIDFDPDNRQGDLLASFSLRGPTPPTPVDLTDLTKPDVAAPGVLTYAPVPGGYANISGTSMSSPHAAGAAALVRQAHPDWTAPETLSALMMTAEPEGFDDDGASPWDADDVGSGRIDVARAVRAGLVLDEVFDNYLAADPDLGGDVKTLNLASLRNLNCNGCSWTRTVRNTVDEPAQWTATGVAITPGFDIEIEPANFSFSGDPNETLQLTITATPTQQLTEEIAFGKVVLSEAGGQSPDQHLTVAIMGFIPGTAPPKITLDREAAAVELEAGESAVETLTIGNLGDLDLDWSIEFAFQPATAGEPVLWQQTQASGSGVVSSFFIPMDTGAYSADDFLLPASAGLSHIAAEGFMTAATLEDAETLAWFIFEDDDGVPAGDPETSPELAVWSHITTPDGTGVDVTNNDLALDIVAATGTTLELDAGHYWLSVFPSVQANDDDTGQRWNWFAGAPAQAGDAQLTAPGDAFGGTPGWTRIAGLTGNEDFAGLAFTLRGILNCDGVSPGWLTVDPVGGTVFGGDNQPVALTFDATALEPGDHEGALCLETNDPERPLVLLSVRLTVTPPQPLAGIAPAALEFDIDAGDPTSRTLEITNSGTADLEWSIAEGTVQTASTASAPRSADSTVSSSGPVAGSFEEHFDQVGDLPAAGWAMLNRSDPLGATDWFQGNPDAFSAHQGAPDSYIAANFQNTAGTGTISNWLLTPEVVLETGTTMRFWTRTFTDNQFPDRLEVRMSTAGASVDVGESATDVGDFDRLLVSINENLVISGYPQQWSEFVFDIDDLPAATGGRFAFRYFVTNGGPGGTNSNYIGIDTFSISQSGACANPADVPWLNVAPAAGTTPPDSADQVQVSVDPDAASPGINRAQLCIATNDPLNSLIGVPVTLFRDMDTADLAVRVVPERGSFIDGQPAGIEILVNNFGPMDVTDALVEVEFGAGLVNLQWECTPVGGANCPDASGSGDIESILELPAGSSASFTAQADSVDGGEVEEITVAAQVNSSTVPDLEPDNNLHSVTLPVVPERIFIDRFEQE